MNRKNIFIVLILVTAFFIRLYRFSSPIADWHEWRQADTSSVSRHFVTDGIDVLHPRYDDISNVQSGLDNPNGYRFVEFPIFNAAQAGLFELFGKLTLEEWGRTITIISSLLTIIFLYLLMKKYVNGTAGLFTAFIYAVLPYNIFYGRTILPDPSMTMTVIGGIYFFDQWLNEREGCKTRKQFLFFCLSIIFTAISVLLKPFAIFFILPIIWLSYNKFGLKMFIRWELWLFILLTLIPFIWWRLWIQQYPAGIPVSNWLFNGGNIRFTGAYFYWIFAERISKLIFGYWGLPVFLIGILSLKKNYAGLILSFLLSAILYVVIVARGNVQHDYYQIPVIPVLAMLFGLGADYLVHSGAIFGGKIRNIAILAVCIIFSLAFGWYQVRDYFNINNPSMIAAGSAINQLTPKNAKIIAPLDGDTAFLYACKRQGWPSFEKSTEELIKMGADYLVFLNPSKEDLDPGKRYKVIAQTNQFVIFDLHSKSKVR